MLLRGLLVFRSVLRVLLPDQVAVFLVKNVDLSVDLCFAAREFAVLAAGLGLPDEFVPSYDRLALLVQMAVDLLHHLPVRVEPVPLVLDGKVAA